MKRPTLLAIFAHPDDESFGPGGTLALHAAHGVDVHVCILTDGAAGSADEKHVRGYESLAHRRREELQRAAQQLGATLHHLEYRDSGMEGSADNLHPASLVQAPLDEVACRLVRLIRELCPQVILTHDATGGYFHPDHIKVNRAVEQAWQWAPDPDACGELALAPWRPSRLYWSVIPQGWLKGAIRVLRFFGQDPTRFGRNNDIDLTRLGIPNDQIHLRVEPGAHLRAKRRASQEHASQGGGSPILRRLPLWLVRRLMGAEAFVQVYPPPPPVFDGFFDGLPSDA